MGNQEEIRIVVVGSSNTDLVVSCSRLPRPGETIMGRQFRQTPGGKGANQAVAAVRAGAQVTLVGACGDDALGRAARKHLKAEGIDLRYFRICRGVTSGVANIMVGGRSGENLIAVAPGANAKLTADDVERARPAIAKSHAVLAQLEVPLAAVERAARIAGEEGVPFYLNPAPAPGRGLPGRLLRQVSVIVPNLTEARSLTGRRSPSAAARHFVEVMGVPKVVITLGNKGCLLRSGEGETLIGAGKVKAVDAVGAGDCFHAWIGVALASGLNLEMAARLASRAAAVAVTREGAQEAMPHRDMV